MASLLEIIGQKEVALAESHGEYARLWNVLKDVKEGRTPIQDVTLFVDAAGRCGWKIVPEPTVDDEMPPGGSPPSRTASQLIDDT